MRSYRTSFGAALVLMSVIAAGCTIPPPPGGGSAVTIASVGDFGYDHPYIQELGKLVDRIGPDYVLTTGDNVQTPLPVNGTARYDLVVGRHFCKYMAQVAPGPHCPSGGLSATNRFFPATGNHDYTEGPIQNFINYFTLPGVGTTSTSPTGSELYYDVVLGPVHVFFIDSDPIYYERNLAPAQQVQTNTQRAWLQQAMSNSPTAWQVVVMHDPPFGSSSSYGSSSFVQWPYATWGADLVLNGHAAVYERVMRNGIPYVTNGLGGGLPGSFGTPVSGSVVRYNEDIAVATRLSATETSMRLDIITAEDEVIDSHVW